MYSGNGHGGDTDFNGQYPSDDSYISGDRSDADYHTTLSSDQTLHNTPFGTANTLNNLPATSLRSFEDLLANELQTVSPQWTQEWPQVMSKAGSLVETITQKKEVRWAKGIIDHRGVRYRPAQGSYAESTGVELTDLSGVKRHYKFLYNYANDDWAKGHFESDRALERSETQRSVEAQEQLSLKISKIREGQLAKEAARNQGLKRGALTAVVVTVIGTAVIGAIAASRESKKEAEEKANHKAEARILKSVESSDEMKRAACREMHERASKHEGMAQEETSEKQWEHAMTAFAPIHHQAYTAATDSMIQNISTTPVTNWGTQSPLPVISAAGNISNQTEADSAYENELEMWKWKEYLRPHILQHDLNQDHRDLIHIHALKMMRSASDLPYPIESHQFMTGYTGFFLRMGMPFSCLPHINENKATRALFKQPRIFQQERDAKLELVVGEYYAARSAMKPTPPLPVMTKSS